VNDRLAKLSTVSTAQDRTTGNLANWHVNCQHSSSWSISCDVYVVYMCVGRTTAVLLLPDRLWSVSDMVHSSMELLDSSLRGRSRPRRCAGKLC